MDYLISNDAMDELEEANTDLHELLMRLCAVHMAARGSTTMEPSDVAKAMNTILDGLCSDYK